MFVCVSSTSSKEHSTSSAADLRQHFLNSDWEALARAAPRREPETIVLEDTEEGEDAGKIREEVLPKPIQVGNILFKCHVPTHNAEYSFPDDANCKRMLKRYLATNDLEYYPDVYTDADRTANIKLPATNN